MQTADFDVAIIGQGLAGTTLAWALLRRGQSVIVIDRQESATSSRVAAGLMTPITGPRLAVVPCWDQFWSAATAFYQDLEQRTSARFFHVFPAVRLFRTPAECAIFERRLAQPDFRSLVRSLESPIDPDWFDARLGGFEMASAGRLDTSAFLNVSRSEFTACGAYRQADVDLRHDVIIEPAGVRLPGLEIRCARLIFCQGYQPTAAPWFAPVRFNPAKGEILTLSIPQLTEPRVVHRGIWLAPVDGGTFRAGATFEWKQLDPRPTKAAKAEMIQQLGELLRVPFEVIDQQAAVRPTMHDFVPVVGLHPDYPRIGIFNGLGTRGALWAPRLAEQFAVRLTGGPDLSSEVHVQRWFR